MLFYIDYEIQLFSEKGYVLIDPSVLIAEDVKVNRIILRRFIERYFDENINIYEAENGLEAINIFMDINLTFLWTCVSNFDGIDAIDIIRKIEEK